MSCVVIVTFEGIFHCSRSSFVTCVVIVTFEGIFHCSRCSFVALDVIVALRVFVMSYCRAYCRGLWTIVVVYVHLLHPATLY